MEQTRPLDYIEVIPQNNIRMSFRVMTGPTKQQKREASRAEALRKNLQRRKACQVEKREPDPAVSNLPSEKDHGTR